MTIATLLPNGRQQFVDANGTPLVGGSVYFYIPNTGTLKNTYTSATAGTPNTNPVILDSIGSAAIYGTGGYRQVVLDSLGNTIWDNLTQDVMGLFTPQTSTTDGTAYIGYLQPGGVARSLYSKLLDYSFSVKDFGATGDGATDDTTAIQNALNHLNSAGGTLYFPAGSYRITSALSVTFTYTTVTSILRPSIRGDGPGNTQILWDGVNDPTVFMLTIQRTENADGQGLHAHSSIEGIAFLPISSGKNQYVSGLKLAKWAYLHVSDIWCHRLGYGLWLDQVLSSQFDSLVMRFNNYGIWSIGAPSSSLSAVYNNNALTFTGCIMGANLLGGLSSIDGNLIYVGGTIEANGLGGTSGSGFGAKFQNTSTSGSVVCKFDGTYFEANGTSGDLGSNASTADIWIIHSDASNNLTYSINDCIFNRVASTYAPIGVYVNRTASTAYVLNILGNNFQDYGGYTPSANRKYVSLVDGGGGVNNITVNDAGNYYNQSIEQPNYLINTGVAYHQGCGYRPGAIVYPSVQQSIPDTTTTPIVFSTAIYNFYSIWEGVTHPERLTVPQNVGYVRLSGNIRYAITSTDAADFVLLLQKNGSATFNGNPRVVLQSGPTATRYEMQVISPILPVSAGDYFTLCVSQATGGALNTDATFTSQWFSMEIIG